MREAAAKGASAADGGMGDAACNTWRRKRERAIGQALLRASVAATGANVKLCWRGGDRVETGDAIDVDQHPGAGETDVHGGDEALAAGKDFGLIAVLGEKIKYSGVETTREAAGSLLPSNRAMEWVTGRCAVRDETRPGRTRRGFP